jgi:hypothetical protein
VQSSVTREPLILKEADRKFFQPRWRRVIVTLLCIAWSAFEFAKGDSTWGFLSGAAAIYCVWNFFIAWKSEAKTGSG